jgi:hypothetical protein
MDVKADANVLNEAGLPDMAKVAPFIYGHGIQTYHGIGGGIGPAFSIGKALL